jgi:GNAT superfamily N-acetyltransferase
MNDDITIVSGYVPGVIGRITEMHGTYYAKYWNLGLYFEASVAAELAAFYWDFDPARDGAWVALSGDRIVGGIFILGSGAAQTEDPPDEGVRTQDSPDARLRWFILDPACQGRGIGRQLMNAAMAFCDARGFRRVYLTTFAGLDAARHLYEKFGFRVCAEVDATALTGDSSKIELILERFLPR